MYVGLNDVGRISNLFSVGFFRQITSPNVIASQGKLNELLEILLKVTSSFVVVPGSVHCRLDPESFRSCRFFSFGQHRCLCAKLSRSCTDRSVVVVELYRFLSR